MIPMAFVQANGNGIPILLNSELFRSCLHGNKKWNQKYEETLKMSRHGEHSNLSKENNNKEGLIWSYRWYMLWFPSLFQSTASISPVCNFN